MADAITDVFTSDEKQLAKLKAWFFSENVRINEEKEALEREKARMNRENELFEKKLEILKKELYKLANDKKALEQERIRISRMKEQAKAERMNVGIRTGTTTFFRGVGSELALKKRYKDLLKIYHPDNMCGDTDTIQRINQEYTYLKKRYCD